MQLSVQAEKQHTPSISAPLQTVHTTRMSLQRRGGGGEVKEEVVVVEEREVEEGEEEEGEVEEKVEK